MKTIVEQLNEVYWKSEWWQSHNETPAGITNYHQAMLDKENIITYVLNGELLGYVEHWNINFEQFGRLICHEKFIAPLENTTDGNICYVANTWIKPEYRNSFVYKELKYKFFEQNSHCEFYVGEALRKKHCPIKVFKRSEIWGKIKPVELQHK